MPIMYRDPKNKATKLAWKIIGKPANLQYKENAVNKKLNERLIAEESRLSK